MLPDATYTLTPDFDYQEVLDVYNQVRVKKGSQVLIECSQVASWPASRMAFLTDLLRRFDRRRIAWSVNNLPESVTKAVNYLLYERRGPDARMVTMEEEVVDQTLGRTSRFLKDFVAQVRLLQDIVYWTMLGPFFRHGYRYARTLYEITERGANSLPIVALVAVIMGLILAMQAGAQLQLFGASIYVANLVGISIVRELGPLLAAMLVTGRCGSAITAEIGSMVTSEEMDALRAMGISITKYVVVPKFVALIIIMPCLTVFADIIGIAGGYAFCVLQYNLPSAEYINQTIQAVSVQDVVIGIVKSIADAIIIAAVAVHQGLTTSGGAEGIGKSTTRSVVHSIVAIAIAHLFFTGLFYYTGHTATLSK
jgi:phospholipid/cholesterol/gamma-HCH transport system permease protein